MCCACVTGVAGSGKSSLIQGSVAGRDGVVVIDQGAIKGSRRSNPATYTGLLEPIRKAFAKANGVKPALFSSNSEGACPTCNGAGVIFTELGVMATVESTCEDCEGRRFQASVLEYKLGGRNIAEVLAMSMTEAEAFFGAGEAKTPAAHKILDRLVDVGLGYLTLGQPLTTLSGGERQRVKLATQMAEKGDVYVLDEPTTGLHLADVQNLLGLLDRLVESGKSVIVIEHHQAVMAHADWIIDLGPGAGHDGGRVVFEGTPAELVAGPVHPHRRAPRGLRRRLTKPVAPHAINLRCGVGDSDDAHCPRRNHDDAGDVFADNQFVALRRVLVLFLRVVDEEEIAVVRSGADNSFKAFRGRRDCDSRPCGCFDDNVAQRRRMKGRADVPGIAGAVAVPGDGGRAGQVPLG